MQRGALLFVLLAGCAESALQEAPPDAGGTMSTTDTTVPAADAGAASNGEAAASPAPSDADASSTDGAAPAPLACANGKAESEPNDAMTSATMLAMGRNCGESAPGDVDFFTLVANGPVTMRIEAASNDVEVALVDGQGSLDVRLTREGMIRFHAGSPSFIRVTAKSKQSYAIVLE